MWGQSWGAVLPEPFSWGPGLLQTRLALLLRIAGCDGADEEEWQAWPWVAVPFAAPRVLNCSAENHMGAGQAPYQRVWGLRSLTGERQVGCAMGPGAGEQRPAQRGPSVCGVGGGLPSRLNSSVRGMGQTDRAVENVLSCESPPGQRTLCIRPRFWEGPSLRPYEKEN